MNRKYVRFFSSLLILLCMMVPRTHAEYIPSQALNAGISIQTQNSDDTLEETWRNEYQAALFTIISYLSWNAASYATPNGAMDESTPQPPQIQPDTPSYQTIPENEETDAIAEEESIAQDPAEPSSEPMEQATVPAPEDEKPESLPEAEESSPEVGNASPSEETECPPAQQNSGEDCVTMAITPTQQCRTIASYFQRSIASTNQSTGSATQSTQPTIEAGRSSVPTAPMITWQQQRELVARWRYTGSLTPKQSSSGTSQTNTSQCPPSSGSQSVTPPVTDEEASGSNGTGGITDGHYTPGSLTSQELSLYEAVNAERTARGLSALPIDMELTVLARLKSSDMINNGYFAHESPTYGTSSNMLTSAGYSYTSVSENIARSGSVEKGHAALMSSDGHRRAILGSQWTRVGIGVVNDSNGYPYITQLFVR